VIQLKRFKSESYGLSKTSSRVIFPIENLDMAPYISELNQLNLKDTTYNLCAISDHRGASIEYGHYVAYCKNGINNLWYEFNDEDVIHIPKEDLEKELITKKNAYLLFYTRKFNKQ